jgi:hypothetical protein
MGIDRREKKQLLMRIKKLRKFAVKGKTGHEANIPLKGQASGKVHRVVTKKVSELRPDLLSTAVARLERVHASESNRKASIKVKYF